LVTADSIGHVFVLSTCRVVIQLSRNLCFLKSAILCNTRAVYLTFAEHRVSRGNISQGIIFLHVLRLQIQIYDIPLALGLVQVPHP
jgi:hypothetical protein